MKAAILGAVDMGAAGMRADDLTADATRSEAAALSVGFVSGVGAVAPAAWDACAGGDDPFLSHGFFKAAEDGGVASPQNGWTPRHLVVRDAHGRLLAIAPTYLKSNSDDEYWSDDVWAAGYQRAGGRYFPKLTVAVPFAPVSGRRFLIAPELSENAAQAAARAVVVGLEQGALANGLSSVHVLFANEPDARRLEEAGWSPRYDIQFEWKNQGYRDFADFLDALTARKRCNIQRQRRAVAKNGYGFQTLTGDRMKAEDWDDFIRLFNALHQRRQTPQRLTRGFFIALGENIGSRLKITFVVDDGVRIATTLRALGERRTYLRHWGCAADRKFLHFETSYYREIESAIERGCDVIEGGYGGTHKLERGFSPKLVRSLHWFSHPAMRAAAAQNLRHEQELTMRRFADLAARTPYRQTPSPSIGGRPTPITGPA